MFFDEKKPARMAGQGVERASHGAVNPSLQMQDSEDKSDEQDNTVFPPGIYGMICDFFLEKSPRPVRKIALAAATAMMSVVTGRAWNVSGLGLNTYILVLAPTGTGKDIVSSGTDAVFDSVAQSVPGSVTFRGPGELVSSAGLIKWMAENPSSLSVLGEVGLLMQQMAHPNANAHLKGLQRTLLQFYSKSGRGNSFDPSAYADKANNTGRIYCPNLNIIGETVPHTFYELLDEAIIASGLLPRFLTFEYTGKRGYLIEGRDKVTVPEELKRAFADLCGTSLAITARYPTGGEPINVGFTPDAQLAFVALDRRLTDEMNDETKTEVRSHLKNRAHEKCLKLAALAAVGINPHNPIIDINCFNWAVDIVEGQTKALLAKFERGEVGQEAGNEAKQQSRVRAVIREYIRAPAGKYASSGCTELMHNCQLFTFKYLSNRLIKTNTFKDDKAGATQALQRAVDQLMENDEIRRCTVPDMMKSFGTAIKSYGITNLASFMDATD